MKSKTENKTPIKLDFTRTQVDIIYLVITNRIKELDDIVSKNQKLKIKPKKTTKMKTESEELKDFIKNNYIS
jgi:hypothetical protein